MGRLYIHSPRKIPADSRDSPPTGRLHHIASVLPRTSHRRRASLRRHFSIRGSILRTGIGIPATVPCRPAPRATSTLAPEAESSIQAAMHAELWAIIEERDRLRCELVDSRAEVADYWEFQTELTRARARVAHLDREMARLSAELDRVHKRARNLAHP
ncbi:hypothetical protein CDL15_Pgr021989 [Punica granatum]|uniref:Uncharacterized protein n=1 Tax=Punica granatum TaxID=22663 RepID=A0A218WZ67_PUNGR|nr:hypothetical protein CDL15_Pgr021989 [Punica granatum]